MPKSANQTALFSKVHTFFVWQLLPIQTGVLPLQIAAGPPTVAALTAKKLAKHKRDSSQVDSRRTLFGTIWQPNHLRHRVTWTCFKFVKVFCTWETLQISSRTKNNWVNRMGRSHSGAEDRHGSYIWPLSTRFALYWSLKRWHMSLDTSSIRDAEHPAKNRTSKSLKMAEIW